MTIRTWYDTVWREGPSDRDARRRMEADADAVASLEPLAGYWVLDIGVGSGGSVEALARRGARVVAADISFEALRRARARVGSDARYVVLDAHRLPFRPRTFGRASLFSVLMFLDPDRFLPELASVLDADGRAAIVEPVSGNPLVSLWRASSRRYAGLARWRSSAEWRELFARRFNVRAWESYYLLPFGTLLPPGAPRSAWRSAERMLARASALAGIAWVVRGEIGPRGKSA